MITLFAVASLAISALLFYRKFSMKNFDTSKRLGGGQPRQEVSPDIIDPIIYPLVVALNRAGLSLSVASCQGHWESLTFIRHPYVTFTAREGFAEMLDREIYSEKARQHLYFYWDLNARFGPDRHLHYCLELSPAQLKGQVEKLLPWQLKSWWNDFRDKEKADVAYLASVVDHICDIIGAEEAK